MARELGPPLVEVLRLLGVLPLTNIWGTAVQRGVRFVVPREASSEVKAVVKTLNAFGIGTDARARQMCIDLGVEGEVLDFDTREVLKKYDVDGNSI